MKEMYFFRDFKRFTGGHLKVWDYYNHVKDSDCFIPYIYFSKGSLMDESNLWRNEKRNVLENWNPTKANCLFIGGMDWLSLPEPNRKNWPKPIINLVQHVRHAQSGTPLYEFLSNHAIRICVSQEVADSILATGKVNGPVFTIPNGIDYSFITRNNLANSNKDVDLLIVGLKNPSMAKELVTACKDLPVTIRCLTEIIPRLDFMRALAGSRIAVLLPHITEGFYLPAIEGMAMKTIVICPDCIGNRSFCINGENCIMPAYTLNGIFSAINTALAMNSTELNHIQNSAKATSKLHNLDRERCKFFEILANVSSMG